MAVKRQEKEVEAEEEVKKQKKEKMEKGPSLQKKKKGEPQKGPSGKRMKKEWQGHEEGEQGHEEEEVEMLKAQYDCERLNDRHPIVKMLKKCSFTHVALKQLKRAGVHFDKGKPTSLPDGRWIIETQGNGSSLVMKGGKCSWV